MSARDMLVCQLALLALSVESSVWYSFYFLSVCDSLFFLFFFFTPIRKLHSCRILIHVTDGSTFFNNNQFCVYCSCVQHSASLWRKLVSVILLSFFFLSRSCFKSMCDLCLYWKTSLLWFCVLVLVSTDHLVDSRRVGMVCSFTQEEQAWILPLS